MMEYALIIEKGSPFKTIRTAVILSLFGEEYILYPAGDGDGVKCRRIAEIQVQNREIEIFREWKCGGGSIRVLKLLKRFLLKSLEREMSLYRENPILYKIVEEEFAELERIFGSENENEAVEEVEEVEE